MINSSIVLRKNLRVGMINLDGGETTLIHSTDLSKIYFVTCPENKKVNITLVWSPVGEENNSLKRQGGLDQSTSSLRLHPTSSPLRLVGCPHRHPALTHSLGWLCCDTGNAPHLGLHVQNLKSNATEDYYSFSPKSLET